MIKIQNQQFQTLAILENAYGVGYEKNFNEVWMADFSLPLDDPKNSECQPFNYVEITDNEQYIGLFRIIPSLTTKNQNANEVKYQLEHVLATLLDDVLFLYHQNDNLTTADNIQYVLDQQIVKRWKLGTVAFTRYFSYKWENENGLLGPIFSIPKPFDLPYQWTFDTQSYPWTLNLVAPETEVTCQIRYGKNQIGIEREDDPSVIFNRIYPLGYGEGDNQLNIKSVNGGVPYVEDAESIARYGVRSYIWVDKRFEDVDSLKASAESLLEQWKIPKVTYRVSAADVSSITSEDIDRLKMGRIVQMIDDELGLVEARILKESKPDIIGNPGGLQLEIANKTEDLATTQTDLERRQQINELYAQGATNIDSHDYNDNADSQNPAEIMFFLPDELVRINKLFLSFKTDKFRAYERAIEGGGAVVSSTSAGGGTTATSSSGGGVSKSTSGGGGQTVTSNSGGGVVTSTASGGGQTVTSNAGGGTTVTSSSVDFTGVTLRTLEPEGSITPPYEYHDHLVPLVDGQLNHSHSITIASHSHNLWLPHHTHSVDIPSHTHNIWLPSHTHDFEVPNHTHAVTIPNHTHDITLPNHTHAIDFGIYKLDRMPSSVVIMVDGNTVPFTDTQGNDIDLIPYLSKDSSGDIQRGWHTLTITPNDLGRICAQIYTQFFIQSRGGGSF